MPEISSPIIIVNFKCYIEATGKRALKLAQIAEEVGQETGVCIAVASQYSDIFPIANDTSTPVFAQHISPIEPGAHTGSILVEAIKEAGASGTLINHSEKQIPLGDIERSIELVKIKDLISVCCAPDVEKAKEIAKFGPDFVAFEVPELIGTGRAISKEKPDSVREFVKILSIANPNTVPLCGAGISAGEDVRIAFELGTRGVLVASGVVKAKNPRAILLDMVKALTRSF
ncbi:MAG: triose-phosphate isomerase [Candidatus Hodarchaeota archaeon]